MNTLSTKLLVIISILLCWQPFYAQHSTEVFNENAFALRHSPNKIYSMNFELSSRAFLYTNSNSLYQMRQIQISHFSALNLDLKQSIALGVMYRNRSAFENSSNEIRLTQQYNFKSLLKVLRLGHRFRSEQRFYDTFTAFRFRYRSALDIPLQGLKLDVGETYLIFTNEVLLTNAKVQKPEFEYRLSPTLGLLLSKNLNLEFGVELRLNKLNIKTEETLFFNTSIEIKI